MTDSRNPYRVSEFGVLFSAHVYSLGVKREELVPKVSPLVDMPPATLNAYFSAYRQGFVLGSKKWMTPQSFLQPKELLERLARVLFALGVEEDSELVRKLREQEAFKFEFPPQEPTRRVKINHKSSPSALARRLGMLSEENRRLVLNYINSLDR